MWVSQGDCPRQGPDSTLAPLQELATRVLSFIEAATAWCASSVHKLSILLEEKPALEHRENTAWCRALRTWHHALGIMPSVGKRSAGGVFGVKCCAGCRLADVAAAVLLVLTTVPAETVRAVRVTGGGTGELLWASPVGQVARTGRRKWREATVDLPKVRRRPGNGRVRLRIAAGRSRPLWTCPWRFCLMDCSLGLAPHQCWTKMLLQRAPKLCWGGGGGAQDAWGRAQWLWDRPPLKRLRLTISMAQWTVRLPALLALVASQVRTDPFHSRAP